jgi:hypothetical protein
LKNLFKLYYFLKLFVAVCNKNDWTHDVEGTCNSCVALFYDICNKKLIQRLTGLFHKFV